MSLWALLAGVLPSRFEKIFIIGILIYNSYDHPMLFTAE
jgi:hypothetical protein